MASGFGISSKGKHNGAGEELQDIDWDNQPAPPVRGMKTQTAPPPKPVDPWGDSQLVDDEASQLPASEVSAGRESSANSSGEEQDMGADVGAAQVKTGSKKTEDPNNGVKVKKQPMPGKR
jgi:hypothetical protein